MGSVVGVLLFVVAYLTYRRITLSSELKDAQRLLETRSIEMLRLEKELQNAQIRKEINADAANVADDELVERMRYEGYYRR
jgi:hypothetical protein